MIFFLPFPHRLAVVCSLMYMNELYILDLALSLSGWLMLQNSISGGDAIVNAVPKFDIMCVVLAVCVYD